MSSTDPGSRAGPADTPDDSPWGPPVPPPDTTPGAATTSGPAFVSGAAARPGPVPWPGAVPAGPVGYGNSPSGAAGPATLCYVHGDRRASSICRRCQRPICTECMREAPVGWQCADCIHRDSRRAPVTRWRPRSGGTLGATRVTPVVAALIAVNIAVFVVEETNYDSVVERFAMLPALAGHERYRFITAAFLHLSITHIALNMLTLVIVGPAVEAALGRIRCLTAYLIAAFGGEVLSYLVGPLDQYSLGASGAIFGLMGAYFVLARRRGWDLSLITPLIIINLVFSFLDPAIDWRAHVGGLLTGAALAWVFEQTESLPTWSRRTVQPAACITAVALLALISTLPPGHFQS